MLALLRRSQRQLPRCALSPTERTGGPRYCKLLVINANSAIQNAPENSSFVARSSLNVRTPRNSAWFQENGPMTTNKVFPTTVRSKGNGDIGGGGDSNVAAGGSDLRRSKR